MRHRGAWLRAGAPASPAEVETRGDAYRVHLPGLTDEARLDALVASLPTATNDMPIGSSLVAICRRPG